MTHHVYHLILHTQIAIRNIDCYNRTVLNIDDHKLLEQPLKSSIKYNAI